MSFEEFVALSKVHPCDPVVEQQILHSLSSFEVAHPDLMVQTRKFRDIGLRRWLNRIRLEGLK